MDKSAMVKTMDDYINGLRRYMTLQGFSLEGPDGKPLLGMFKVTETTNVLQEPQQLRPREDPPSTPGPEPDYTI